MRRSPKESEILLTSESVTLSLNRSTSPVLVMETV